MASHFNIRLTISSTTHLLLFIIIGLVLQAGRGTCTGAAAANPASSTNIANSTTSSCDNSTAIKSVISSCQTYVIGMAPPPVGSATNACCSALRTTPLSCICSRSSSLPPYIMELINQQAVKNVMRTCGLQIPAGTTCAGVKWGN